MENLFIKTEQPYRGGKLLEPLIQIRGHQCEKCKNSEWLNEPIKLEVHHIDGDRTNNELNNLQLLCPTCHSYTDNYGSKNKKTKEITDEDFINALKSNKSIRQALFALGLSDAGGNYKKAKKLVIENNITFEQDTKINTKMLVKNCPICNKQIGYNSMLCSDCNAKQTRVVKDRPSREELKTLIRTKSFCAIGKEYGVSDNAIRKWCDTYNLPRTKSEIKSYSIKEWELI